MPPPPPPLFLPSFLSWPTTCVNCCMTCLLLSCQVVDQFSFGGAQPVQLLTDASSLSRKRPVVGISGLGDGASGPAFRREIQAASASGASGDAFITGYEVRAPAHHACMLLSLYGLQDSWLMPCGQVSMCMCMLLNACMWRVTHVGPDQVLSASSPAAQPDRKHAMLTVLMLHEYVISHEPIEACTTAPGLPQPACR